MPVVEETRYYSLAAQRSARNRELPQEEEDKLLIIFKLYTVRIRRRHTRSRFHMRGKRLIEEKDMWVRLSDFKHQVNTEEYEQHFSNCLSSLGVPEHAHPNITRTVFPVVEAAETTTVPVIVSVWESHCRFGRRRHSSRREFFRELNRVRPKFTAAATCAIEGLEPVVQVDNSIIGQTLSCAICLEDFDALDQQKPMTRLPCGHHFHVRCIVQCLEISHLCPLCRYAMPTLQDYLLL